MSFQIRMTFFHLWSIKEDILKNAGNYMFISVPIDFYCVDKKYNANQNL